MSAVASEKFGVDIEEIPLPAKYIYSAGADLVQNTYENLVEKNVKNNGNVVQARNKTGATIGMSVKSIAGNIIQKIMLGRL